MLDLAGGTTVYLACGVTDLRKSYNGLAAIIKVAPTRKTGGSTDGYKPLMLGQRLKALAFALLQPLCF